MSDTRLDELEAALTRVRRRLADACSAVRRPPDSVTLVAVSKTWPAADVLRLAALGVVDFGESYDQEAAAKAVAIRAAGVEVHWHFVGRLQRNKCRSIAAYADVVQSVDRSEVADALAAGATRSGREVGVLLQVDLDDEAAPGRGGCRPADLPALADHVAGLAPLQVRGVMAVAPLGTAPRPAFARLHAVAETVRAQHAGAGIISAGMSGDLEAAIAEGATHVRVGTALFGDRRTGG